MKKYLLLLLTLLLVTRSSPSRAAFIPGVTLNSFSAQFQNGNDVRLATNVLTDVGLFGDTMTSIPTATMWLSSATAGAQPGTNFLTFDLGAVRPVKGMLVWNYNEQVSGVNQLVRRGVGRADILTAGEDMVFTTNLPNATFNVAPGRFTNGFQQLFDLGNVSARYVRINVITNHGEIQLDVGVGLSKVRFLDTNVAPRVEIATRNYSSNQVSVLFSESVTPATATNINNYKIQTGGTNSATVTSAAVDVFNNRVVLNTSLLTNSTYSLVVSNIAAASDGTVVTNGTSVNIEPKFLLWLRADAGVTPDGSGFVGQWSDQSGNGNNAVQTDITFQPTFVGNSLNSQPVLHFSGSTTTNFMDLPSSVLSTKGDLSFFVVSRFESFAPPAFHTLISKINSTNSQPAPFDSYVNGTSRNPTFLRGSGFNNTTFVGTSNVLAATGYVISFVTRGTNASQYLNGALNGSGTIPVGLGDLGRPVRIGARDGAFGTRLNGDIAEMIVVRGAVSDSERAAIHSYLGGKYGVTIINLAFNQQPTNMTKLEGQTATFSVSVTASSPTITYQWQRLGTNLPNATNATYTTPVLTQADNNSTFRVLVSVPGSSLLSDTATLTVLADQIKPTVVSAGRKIWNPAEIVVVFSERVQASTATNAANYSLDNGGTVVSAAFGETTDKVVLTTSGLTTNGTYSVTVQNVVDLFGNVILTSSSPVGLFPAPALWLSARTGVTTDTAGYITQWNDLSGNGNNATTLAGAPFTPQLVTNGINNQPVARFDGTNSISLFSPSSPSLVILGDISIYSVARFADYTTYNAFVGKTTINQPASYDFYLGINTGLPTFYRGNGVAGTAVAVLGATAPSAGAPHVVSAVMGGTAVAHYLDGNTNGAGTLSTTIGDNADDVGIGTRTDGVTKLKGDLAELLVFGSALSNTDRAAMDAYFGGLYGIVVGELPRISVAVSGGNVTLTWPNVTGFGLESVLALGGTWMPITTGITLVNGTNTYSAATTNAQQFYRLRKP